jgi:hypothetical protein
MYRAALRAIVVDNDERSTIRCGGESDCIFLPIFWLIGAIIPATHSAQPSY